MENSQKSIEWTLDSFSADVQNMRVNLCSLYVVVPQEVLDRADVVTVLQQVCGK